MKKPIINALILVHTCIGISQTINLEEAIPGPEFPTAKFGSITSSDIDGDGDKDILISGQDINNTHISKLYQNNGNGNFNELLDAQLTGVSNSFARFSDIDNDGDEDLLLTGLNQALERTANLYSNDGTGNFTLVDGTPFEPSYDGAFAFEDVDNDGDEDLLLTGQNSENGVIPAQGITKLYINNGIGEFSEATGTPFEQLRNSTLVFIDIDSDGDKDVIIAGVNNSQLNSTILYSNDGTGIYSLIADSPFEDIHIGAIAASDIDNDGDQDVLLTGQNNTSNFISRLYVNDGSGLFTLLTGTSFQGVAMSTVDFADFDNDNDFDVLITGVTGDVNVVSNIYENQGNNNYILVDSLVGVEVGTTTIIDVNEDNYLDVVIAGTDNLIGTFKTRTYVNSGASLTIDDLSFEDMNQIYPNPSDGTVNFRLDESIVSTINVFKVTGELVYSSDSTNFSSYQIKLNQSAGMYLVEIIADGISKKFKLILK
tara:strand:+ start:2191 stop:3642 length:1452 start_codon:yes stop_codon:yes gene_type:complete